jgi:hypothetical protein
VLGRVPISSSVVERGEHGGEEFIIRGGDGEVWVGFLMGEGGKSCARGEGDFGGVVFGCLVFFAMARYLILADIQRVLKNPKLPVGISAVVAVGDPDLLK